MLLAGARTQSHKKSYRGEVCRWQGRLETIDAGDADSDVQPDPSIVQVTSGVQPRPRYMMPPYLFADVGPPAGAVFLFQVVFVIVAAFLVPALLLFGLWLKRRRRKRDGEPPG
jgi:hypothetical protein